MISGLTGYKLTSESKFKFVYDDDFRKQILEHENLHQSGSKF